MSLQRKFLLAISMVILSFSIIIYSLVITSNKVQNQAQVEKDTLTSKLLSMLTITDSIMFERVKSSMKLLIERGSADQAPELATAVDVRGSTANNLAVNAMEQASQFELVDNLMPLWVAQRHCLAAMVTSICVYQRYFIKGDSNRANGTKLAAKGNAIQEINNDRAYYGQVDILSNPYLTGYEPMRDNAAKVIGMWLTRQI